MLHQRTKPVTGDDATFFLIEPLIARAFILEQLERRLMWSATATVDFAWDFDAVPYDVVVQNVASIPAPPQALDGSFGDNGIVITDATGWADRAQKVLVQNDGKIIVVGYSGSVYAPEDHRYTESHISLARYNSDGSLDETFGNGGVVVAPAENLVHQRYGTADLPAALQKDGKIVVGGCALYRFNTDGSLDAAFGDNGVAAREQTLLIEALAIAPDGKIAISTRYGYVFNRYNADGSLDHSFGNNGTVILDYNGVPSTESDMKVGMDTEIGQIIIDADGRLIAVASIRTIPFTPKSQYGLLRLKVDGSTDKSFGNGGVVHLGFPGNDFSYGDARIALQTDGKIVIAGNGFGLNVARFNTNGALDQTFGNGGLVTRADGGSATGIALQADGKILVASYQGAVRFNADGSFDREFIAAACPGASSVAIAPNGDILITGPQPFRERDQEQASGIDFFLARFEGDSAPASPHAPTQPDEPSQIKASQSELPAGVFAAWEDRLTQSFFAGDDSVIEEEDEVLS